ncbi:MAG: hypothetical protein HY568_02780 [Candidatus Latescibacteria bacterium]|nr:hypothetical protein [Candidatus Latescibacterota bacterium]
MIQVQSLAFGTFAEAEPLNPQFSDGHPKLRVTVDTEADPDVADREVLRRLEDAFPGLGQHHCGASGNPEAPPKATGVLLLDNQVSANLAHILEHLLLEMLAVLGREGRLSGVTCAYRSPPERNDVFVECADRRAGGVAVPLAVETVNAALGGLALAPSYPDAVLCLRTLLTTNGREIQAASRLSRLAGLPHDRATPALGVLARIGLVEEERYSMNLSGEPFYRLVDGRALPHAQPPPHAQPLVAPQFRQE